MPGPETASGLAGARAARRKSVSLDSGSTAGSPSISRTGSAAVDLDGPARLVVVGKCIVLAGQADGDGVRAGLGDRGPERQRHFTPRRQRADDLGRPRHGLTVDRELGRSRQVRPVRYSRRWW